jgi:hypothetical protein
MIAVDRHLPLFTDILSQSLTRLVHIYLQINDEYLHKTVTVCQNVVNLSSSGSQPMYLEEMYYCA